MKLLAWNIRHGGDSRIPRIVEELAAHDPDVIALTEYRATPGVALRLGRTFVSAEHFARLSALGWTDGVAVPQPRPQERDAGISDHSMLVVGTD